MKIRSGWLFPSLLLIEAWFVGSTFGTRIVCTCIFALALTGAYFRAQKQTQNQNPSRLRPKLVLSALLLTTILLTGIWRFGSYVGDTINPLAFGFDCGAHMAAFWSMVLFFRNPRKGNAAMLPLGLMVVMLCIAAGGTSQTITGQTTVALATAVGFMFASNVILRAKYSSGSESQDADSEVTSAHLQNKTLVSGVVLSLILFATFGVSQATSYALPQAQSLLHDQLSSTLENLQDQVAVGSSRYVRGGRLGTIRRHLLGDSSSIALRVYSDSSPGYLRGTAFDRYTGGRWRTFINERLSAQSQTAAIEDRLIVDRTKARTPVNLGSSRASSRFDVRDAGEEELVTIEIHNDPLKGRVFFTPLGTKWIEARSRGIVVSHHDIIEDGIDLTMPYVCGVTGSNPREQLDPQRRALLLAIPSELRSPLKQLSDEICGRRLAPQSKANAIRQYFLDHFSYSLTTSPPKSRNDPIVEFLQTRHAAYCEYFASAAALLLRSQDIPTRYVTGYVTTELSDGEDYWIARNRDAHAWVEAYDELSGRWFPVETTPGRTYDSLLLDGNAGQLSDVLGEQGSQVADVDTDSLFGFVTSWFLSLRATDVLNYVFRFAMVPVFLLLVYLLWRNQKRGGVQQGNAERISLRMLRSMDRRLRKHRLVREKSETIHQFAQRVQSSSSDDTDQARYFQRIADWYRDFAEARYQGLEPKSFSVESQS